MANGPGLSDQLRKILGKLAEGLFPLADWLAAKPFDPQNLPGAGKLPWRNGERLTPEAIGAIEFFETLLTANDQDDALGARWAQLGENALRFSPLRDPARWRARRGL